MHSSPVDHETLASQYTIGTYCIGRVSWSDKADSYRAGASEFEAGKVFAVWSVLFDSGSNDTRR